MNLTSCRAAILGVAILALVSPAQTGRAVALATYDFNTYSASTGSAAVGSTSGLLSAASNFVANGGTVTPATGFLGRGVNGSASNYMFTSTITASTDYAFGLQSQYTYDTQAGAISGATYYSFTLTPASGTALSFPTGSTLTYQTFTRINSGTASPFTTNFFFQSDAATTGTFATIGTTVPTQTQTGTGSTGFVTQTLDLTSLGTLATDQALTFHFLVYDNQQASADDMKFDNFVINGTTVTVPEPSTLAALGLGAAGLALFAARRRVVLA